MAINYQGYRQKRSGYYQNRNGNTRYQRVNGTKQGNI